MGFRLLRPTKLVPVSFNADSSLVLALVVSLARGYTIKTHSSAGFKRQFGLMFPLQRVKGLDLSVFLSFRIQGEPVNLKLLYLKLRLQWLTTLQRHETYHELRAVSNCNIVSFSTRIHTKTGTTAVRIHEL